MLDNVSEQQPSLMDVEEVLNITQSSLEGLTHREVSLYY